MLTQEDREGERDGRDEGAGEEERKTGRGKKEKSEGERDRETDRENFLWVFGY